jgi:hypothetical protein
MLRINASRRGVASLMAMLYLVLFSVLAVGFYAATTTNVQITHNDRRAHLAQMAAESGMDFIGYQLSHVVIPHGTEPEQLFPNLYASLQDLMNSTGNLNNIVRVGDTIRIPSSSSGIKLGEDGGRFRATITAMGQKVQVKVIGWHDDPALARAITLDFGPAEKAARIFDYGIASRGRIVTDGSAQIIGLNDPTKGSILSTTMTHGTPVEVLGKEVSGDISITNPNGIVNIKQGAKVGGETDLALIHAEHVHKGVPEPEFPTVDTDAFIPYATNVYSGGNQLVNTVIPANTNPTFAGGALLQGVIVIEMPNKVTFRGNSTLQGLIVVPNESPGNLNTNLIDFRGNITVSPVSTLPESFGDLRSLTGSVLLAPNVAIRFGGNFGDIDGHLLASQFTFDGNASGTIKGSIVSLDDTESLVKGSSTVTIASTGTMNYPAGVFFSTHYVRLGDTYTEVMP